MAISRLQITVLFSALALHHLIFLSLASSSSEMNFNYVVFSDVDGTLVHYPQHLLPHTNDHNDEKDEGDKKDDNDETLLHLPPSKTGTRGIISHRTLELCRQLRREAPLVLISGMRTTTLFQRLPYLPKADAYASESGGRIFYPCAKNEEGESSKGGSIIPGLVIQPKSFRGCTPDDTAPFSLREDLEWRGAMSQLEAAGPDAYPKNNHAHANSPNNHDHFSHRGLLWDHARQLTRRGFILDMHGYSTAFRINRKHQTNTLSNNDNNDDKDNIADFDTLLKLCQNSENVPTGLSCSTNLGCIDFYPTISGKKNACHYLLHKLQNNDNPIIGDNNNGDNQGSHKNVALNTHAFCMCDDDNDLEMAMACKVAFLPSVTSQSMRQLIDELHSNKIKLTDENDGKNHTEADSDKSEKTEQLIVTEDVTRGIVETKATEASLEMILNRIQ